MYSNIETIQQFNTLQENKCQGDAWRSSGQRKEEVKRNNFNKNLFKKVIFESINVFSRKSDFLHFEKHGLRVS